MMKDFKDIGDDQIRVIGKESMGRKRKHRVGVVVIAALLVVVAGMMLSCIFSCETAGGGFCSSRSRGRKWSDEKFSAP